MKHLLNKSNKLFISSLFIMLFFSCSQQKYKKEDMAVAKVAITQEHKAISKQEKPKQSLNLKIIRSANVKYKVKDVKAITKKITKIVMQQNGYISDLRYSNNLYQKENRFTIKIPQDNFDYLMDSISKFAEFIDYENITSKDVTEEYVDLQTRLKTKLEIKKRYETILRKRAKTVKDILATEEKLRVIQEEIEASQGRLNYLSNKVSLSTIEVNLYETVTYKEEPVSYSQTFFSKIKNGFTSGWELIENIIIGLTYVWPLFILGIIGFIFIKRRRK